MNALAVYLIKRILSCLIVIFLIANAIFAIFFLNGPEHTFIPRGVNPQLQYEVRNDLRLDEPISTQYVNFMMKTLSGEFYTSPGLWRGAEIRDYIYEPAGKTLTLFAAVLVSSLLGGLLIGRLTAGTREGRLSSRMVSVLALGLFSTPITSIVLLYFYLWVEAHVHSFPPRETSAFMLAFLVALGSFVLIAKGKEGYFGNSPRPGPQASGPITKLLVGWVMFSVLFSEPFFSLRGLGLLAWEALNARDAVAFMAIFFLVGVITALTLLALDIAAPFVRPILRKGLSTPVPEATSEESRSTMMTVPTTPSSLGQMARHVIRDYTRRPTGVIAAVIVLVFIAIGILAPVIATVQNPNALSSREPNVFSGNWQTSWHNPLPPSFTPSSYTGLRHPLGTDFQGVDIYSTLLYGAREPVLVMFILVGISLLIGFSTWIAAAYLSRARGTSALVFGWAATVFADFVFAMPILLVLSSWLYARPENEPVFLLVVALPLLVWAFVVKSARSRMGSIRGLLQAKPSDHRGEALLKRFIPRVFSNVLYMTKFVATIGFLMIAALGVMWGFGSLGLLGPAWDTGSWIGLNREAYESGAVTRGAWWMIVPQLVLTALLVGAVYKILETLEQIFKVRYGML